MESRRENGSSRPTEGHFGPGGDRPEWSGGLPAPTHDPNEVTVQIDGVGRCLAGESGGSTAGGTRVMQGFSDTRSVADTPVFVDETGRRSRRYRRIGAAVGLLCAGYAVVMAATLVSGNSSAPWLPVPDPNAPNGIVGATTYVEVPLPRMAYGYGTRPSGLPGLFSG